MTLDRKNSFDEVASVYDKGLFTSDKVTSLERFKKLFSLLGSQYEEGVANSGVLEIGCGTGIYTQHLVNRNRCFVVATDLSENMLRFAKSRSSGKNVGHVQCDVEVLPFLSNSFNLVVSFACLHHVNNTQAVFHEIFRVLESDGRFIMMEPNPLNPVNLLLAIIRPIEKGMLFSRPVRWQREAVNAKLITVSYNCSTFFPGWPIWLTKVYSKIEPLLERVLGIRRLGIFYYCHFIKKG